MFAGLFWAKRIKYSNILFFLVALVLGLLLYICKKQMGGTYWNLKKLFKLTCQTKNESFSIPPIFGFELFSSRGVLSLPQGPGIRDLRPVAELGSWTFCRGEVGELV